jgi:energy-coupling factor transporter ATP-binding protein EcfA2
MEAIQPNEHVVIAGMTGSGKSSLAERYLIAYRNVIVIDPKWRFKWRSAQIQDGRPVPIFHDMQTLFRKLGSGRAIYRPTKEGLRKEAIDEFYDRILQRGETVVVSDETYPLTPGGQMTESHQACLTRGRELGVGVWTLTQRPMLVGNFCLSEAMHCFSFRLRLESDRKKMVGIMGPDVMQNPPGQHGFWYSHETWERPVLVPYGIKL